MKKITNSILNFMSTRLGFVLTLLLLYWFKTMWAYTVDFNLDIQGSYQTFLAVINPLPISLLFIGLALYVKRTKLFYSLAFGIYLLLFVWLISNSIYYREFTDFVTVNTMLASSKVSAGLGAAALELFRPWDVIYILDFPILAFFFLKKWVRMDNRPFNKRASFAVTSLSAMLFSANLFLAEIDRPELLTRGFSNYYVVRALGLPAFLGYSANQTYAANKERSKASEADLKPVEEYIQQHYAKPNPEYFGMAKGRNVIYIHLESFQQFLIDYKLNVNDKEYEVTPFLNSLYHSNETFAFSNVFNQVKAGYTPEERRELERRLRNGELLGLASTSALELGIDISGLDAVIVAGWPGTRASFTQRIGRAGRGGQDALAVLIADDNPLDTYLVHHPEAIFGQDVEATVFDPTNPYVLSPQLCAAAQEAPIRVEELNLFGPHTEVLLDRLVQQGYLRRRTDGWYWTHAESAADLVDIRGTGGGPYQLIDAEDGTLVGTMDAAHAMSQGHPGAVYIHQNVLYVVDSLSEDERVILLNRATPDFYTRAIETTEVRVLAERARARFEDARGASPDGSSDTVLTMHRGQVQVTNQVTGYKRFSVYGGEHLGNEPMPMPPEVLITEAVWFTFEPSYLFGAGVTEEDGPGTLHATEHAAIGLLPLIATSDRWDLGGLSTLLHVDTGQPTIFVYDATPGGAGISERGFNAVRRWLNATLEAIESCGCDNGCPSCVHSPKCGNRNEPLSKAGAMALLRAMLKSIDGSTDTDGGAGSE